MKRVAANARAVATHGKRADVDEHGEVARQPREGRELLSRARDLALEVADPFSTAINSLGEPADTSTSREASDDAIHSRGRPTLIVNTVGLAISKAVAGGVSITVLAELF